MVPGVGHDGGLLLRMSGDSVCLRLRDGAQTLVVRVVVWEAQVCITMVSGCGYAREGERLSEEPYEGTFSVMWKCVSPLTVCLSCPVTSERFCGQGCPSASMVGEVAGRCGQCVQQDGNVGCDCDYRCQLCGCVAGLSM